jgi:hypothetical protein
VQALQAPLLQTEFAGQSSVISALPSGLQVVSLIPVQLVALGLHWLQTPDWQPFAQLVLLSHCADSEQTCAELVANGLHRFPFGLHSPVHLPCAVPQMYWHIGPFDHWPLASQVIG